MVTPLPRRLQLSRRRGFDLQALSRSVNGLEAVNCARPSRFSNPARPTPGADKTHCAVWFAKTLIPAWNEGVIFDGEQWAWRDWILLQLGELRGKNLACWCDPFHQFCHCDTLIVLANAPKCEEARA
jgi:hypothetical protein